jgi:hypothetical protein
MEHVVLPIFRLPCTLTWEIASFVANIKSAFPDWNSVTDILSLFGCLLLIVRGCFVALTCVPIFLRNLRLARKGTVVFGYYAGSHMARFVSHDGQEVRFRTYSQSRHNIGQKLRVIYNPDRPYEAEIALRPVLWSFPTQRFLWLLFPVILFILLMASTMPFYLSFFLAVFFAWLISTAVDLFLWALIRLPATPLQTDEERDETTIS